MPEWFVTLGYITLAAVMVLFLLGIVIFLVSLTCVTVREWLEKKPKRRS